MPSKRQYCIQAFVVIVSTTSSLSFAADIVITYPDKPFSTREEFLSFTLDPYLKHNYPVPWANFSFDDPGVLTLANGLAPAFLRFGGTDADWAVFYPDKTFQGKQKVREDVKDGFIVPITKIDVDNLRKLAKAAGGKLLYDLNIQQRKGANWDPSNTEELLQYLINSTTADTVDDVIFELGNEWQYPIYHPTPDRLAQDFLQLNETLHQYPEFRNSYIVGPDISSHDDWDPSHWLPIIHSFVKIAGSVATAVTVHHYHFNGHTAKLPQFFDLKYYDKFGELLTGMRAEMDSAGGQHLELWIGETADSNQGGTPGITDTFAGSFLWIDKLGMAASKHVSLVARQDFYGSNYPLLYENLEPTPDYWSSYVFKKLVGTKVLTVDLIGGQNTTRPYAHCTNRKAGFTPGSITLYVINIADTNDTLHFNSFGMGREGIVHYYTLVGDGSVTSQNVLLNGKRLVMINKQILPDVVQLGKVQRLDDSLILEAKSITFVVIPPWPGNVHWKYCT